MSKQKWRSTNYTIHRRITNIFFAIVEEFCRAPCKRRGASATPETMQTRGERWELGRRPTGSWGGVAEQAAPNREPQSHGRGWYQTPRRRVPAGTTEQGAGETRACIGGTGSRGRVQNERVGRRMRPGWGSAQGDAGCGAWRRALGGGQSLRLLAHANMGGIIGRDASPLYKGGLGEFFWWS